MACDTILIVSQEAFLCRPYRYCLLYSPQHSWGISVFIYNELRMRGYSVDAGMVPIVERDQNDKVIL